MKAFLGFLVGVVVIGFGWWFYNQNKMTQKVPVKTTGDEMTETSQVKVFNISGANYRFNPSTITIKKGDKVQINFTAEDLQHNLVIDELNVQTPVTVAGETSSVEFTADKAGSFEFYCSVGNHRAMGMVGELIVQ